MHYQARLINHVNSTQLSLLHPASYPYPNNIISDVTYLRKCCTKVDFHKIRIFRTPILKPYLCAYRKVRGGQGNEDLDWHLRQNVSTEEKDWVVLLRDAARQCRESLKAAEALMSPRH